MDLIWAILIFCLFIIFFTFLALGIGLVLLHQDISFIPKKKFKVKLFNKSQKNEKILSRIAEAWLVKRKNVRWLKLNLGLFGFRGVDLDAGYISSQKESENPDGKIESYIELWEKTPGVLASANFEPYELPHDITAFDERKTKESLIALKEISLRMTQKEIPNEDIKALAATLESIKNNLNDNFDKMLDHDRRLAATQVSGWGEMESVNIEKSAYRVVKEDIILKYAPWVAIIAIVLLISFVVIFIGDFAFKSIEVAAKSVSDSNNRASENYLIQARACGWIPEQKNNTIPENLPPGLKPQFG